jgi:hypothetical protein
MNFRRTFMHKKARKISIVSWSWILILLFFLLSFIHPLFGILGFACMFTPIIIAASGRGKMHCSHICPRGSFLGKFLPHISFKRPLLKWMKTTWFKTTLMILMFSRFIYTIVITWGDINNLLRVVVTFLFASFLVGIIMGIIFLPRSWCQICPMGQMSHLIDKGFYGQKNRNKTGS